MFIEKVVNRVGAPAERNVSVDSTQVRRPFRSAGARSLLEIARSINITRLTGWRNLVQPPLLMDSCQKGIE